MKNSILAIIILFSSFAFGQEDTPKTPKIGIKVPKGETVVLNDVSIKFLEVVEDSRCPKDVDCIWAGRAIVKVAVAANGKTTEKTLIFGAVKPDEEKNTNLYSSANLAINGLKLDPYPTSKSSGKDTGYTLLISKEKNN
ncbi:hypothetical protein [Aequorivita marina]|uniref:hypothetical protein n=1 Tax=Aequorivita marina TaxID=3073654 RepID=UPI002875C95F|nr:hypothetical protein [Aequorivita sp. S2608]MDS1297497.1 hypothetical protein [Aequorivita sp. S2608]